MCGIVGYLGHRQAVPVLLDGLRHLEYRGYDSAGLAFFTPTGRLVAPKAEGRLSRLEARLDKGLVGGTVGIGHVRWATHGQPSDLNAHPHLDTYERLAVVHNGIIENYLSLRERLQAAGYTFRSETDTEVLPHLIRYHWEQAGGRIPLVEAVRRALVEVEGSYALAVLSEDAPETIIAARKDSPLVVGVGEGEVFLASDIPAFLGYTRDFYVLEDGELAVITRSEVKLSTLAGEAVSRPLFHVEWDPGAAEKGGFADFMLKEIHEQPRALRDTLSGRIERASGRVVLPDLEKLAPALRACKKLYIIACGTAYHAGLVGKKVIEAYSGIPVEVDLASEFRYRQPLVGEDCLALAISQSGETADTLAAMREARARGARVLAITNVVGSSVAREAEALLFTWAGPEIAVASTKAYLTQLICLYLFALYLAQERGTLPEGKVAELVAALQALPQGVEETLAQEKAVQDLARRFHTQEDIFYIGRGLDYAVAMEGQLKLKEISYIHAEAYAAGELKHGTLALITEGVPVFALATQPHLSEKMLSNIREVKARGATVVAIIPEGEEAIASEVDAVLRIPVSHPDLAPVLAVVPMQLFAYYTAKARGCDVDKPRNLAKSVTVE